MKKKWKFIFILGLSLCFYGCNKVHENEMIVQQCAPFTVEEAEAWYETRGSEELSLKSGSIEDAGIRIKPDWCNAFASEDDLLEVIEGSLLVQGYFGFAEETSSTEWKKAKNPKMITSLSRLVSLRYKKDGRIEQFLMTIMGDKDYHDKGIGDLSDNSYLTREKHFSGYIFYHDLRGNFVNGWKYVNGKIVRQCSQSGSKTSLIHLKKADCVAVTVTLYNQFCTDWYTNGRYQYTSCENRVSEYEDYYLYCSYEPTEGNGGGGGGYDGEIPPQQPCACLDVCPICHKCADGLKSGSTTCIPVESCTGHPAPATELFFDEIEKINIDSPTLLQEVACLIRTLANSSSNLLTSDVITGIGDSYNTGYEITEKNFNYQGHNVKIVVIYDEINVMNHIGKRTESSGTQVVFHEIYVRAKMNSSREMPNLIRLKFEANDLNFLNSVWNHINGTTNLWDCN